jgi:hypothetical protein
MGFRVVLSLALAVLVVRIPTLAAQDPNLAPNAPPDRPLQAADQAAAAHLDSLVRPYIAQARATYPTARQRFLAGLPPHHMFSITTALEDAQGHREIVFVAVDSLVRDSVYGRIRSPIYLVR